MADDIDFAGGPDYYYLPSMKLPKYAYKLPTRAP